MNLSELFDQARQAAPVVPISAIQSLVESGKTSPLATKHSFRPRRITQMFNPLKFLIMITTIVMIISMLLIWNPLDHRDANFRLSHPDGRQKTEDRRDTYMRLPPSQTFNEETKSLGVTVLNVQKPMDTAPKDSVLQGMILDLSKEELTRLGFLFDDEGFYYLNRLPNGNLVSLWSWKSGKHTASGFEESKSANPFNKQKASSFDFYPIVSTDLAGQNLHAINLSRTFTVDSFKIMNDTIVPVLFKASTFGGNFTSDLLIWFKPSDRFFGLMGNEKARSIQKRIELVKELISNSPDQMDRVSYDFKPDQASVVLNAFDSLKTLKLSAEVFKCLGMNVTTESIDIIFIREGISYKWSVNKHGVGISRSRPDSTGQLNNLASDSSKVKAPGIYAIGTHIFGRVTSDPVGYSVVNSDLLIPVQISDSYMDPFIRKMIFWIYPDEHFFRCLPPVIGVPMEKEFNYQKKRLDPNFVPRMGGSIGIGGGAPAREPYNLGHPIGIPDKGLKKDSAGEEEETIPCVYFTNLCESLPGLDYLNLYPNPVADRLNVDLVLQKAKKIRFRVLDLGGRVISDTGVPESYPQGGQFKHQVDISKLQAGLYLLVMTDEEGARVTRRFVKN